LRHAVQSLQVWASYGNHVHLDLSHHRFASNVDAAICPNPSRLCIPEAKPAQPLRGNCFRLLR
jgi:hypothetical protein